MSEERRAILQAIEALGGKATPKQIAEYLGKSSGAVRVTLHRMRHAGELALQGDYYTPCNTCNTCNAVAPDNNNTPCNTCNAVTPTVTGVTPVTPVTTVTPLPTPTDVGAVTSSDYSLFALGASP